ncbi:MAG: diguanylate cyclase [Planctomycetaceae bacterium]
MRMLIAEDDPVSRLRLEKALANWGYKVTSVDNGDAAWEILDREDAPRLALLDWVMPGLDGTDVCRRVRAAEKGGAYTYLVLLTARTAPEDVVEGLRAGADEYLCKPILPMELKFRLRSGRRIVRMQRKLLKTCTELRRQATHDSLTRLWNRAAIREFLAQELIRALRQQTSFGVALVDIDRFKLVNDTYGHMTGDRILRQTAERLHAELRPYDRLGRHGGEEFLVVLPGITLGSAATHAERLRSAVDHSPIAFEEGEVPITVSVGIAVHEPGDLGDEESLLQAADAALYLAKHNGRNRVEVASLIETAADESRPLGDSDAESRAR